MKDRIGIHWCNIGTGHCHFLVGEDFPLPPFYSREAGRKMLEYFRKQPKMELIHDQLSAELELETQLPVMQLEGDPEIIPHNWLSFIANGGVMNVHMSGFRTPGGVYVPTPIVLPIRCDFIARPDLDPNEEDLNTIAWAGAVPRSVTEVLGA